MVTTDRIQERIVTLALELSKESGEFDENFGVCWLDTVENYAIGDVVSAHGCVQLMRCYQTAAKKIKCDLHLKIGSSS